MTQELIRVYSCDECNFYAPSRTKIKKHLKAFHPIRIPERYHIVEDTRENMNKLSSNIVNCLTELENGKK